MKKKPKDCPLTELVIDFSICIDDLRGGIAALAAAESNIDKKGDYALLDEAIRKTGRQIENLVGRILDARKERNRKNRGYR